MQISRISFGGLSLLLHSVFGTSPTSSPTPPANPCSGFQGVKLLNYGLRNTECSNFYQSYGIQDTLNKCADTCFSHMINMNTAGTLHTVVFSYNFNKECRCATDPSTSGELLLCVTSECPGSSCGLHRATCQDCSPHTSTLVSDFPFCVTADSTTPFTHPHFCSELEGLSVSQNMLGTACTGNYQSYGTKSNLEECATICFLHMTTFATAQLVYFSYDSNNECRCGTDSTNELSLSCLTSDCGGDSSCGSQYLIDTTKSCAPCSTNTQILVPDYPLCVPYVPTPAPTVAPTKTPTLAPTSAPTLAPTPAPTLAPTSAPTLAPTLSPTPSPIVARQAASDRCKQMCIEEPLCDIAKVTSAPEAGKYTCTLHACTAVHEEQTTVLDTTENTENTENTPSPLPASPCNDNTHTCAQDGGECIPNMEVWQEYTCQCKPGFEQTAAWPQHACTYVPPAPATASPNPAPTPRPSLEDLFESPRFDPNGYSLSPTPAPAP